ncbi:MAG: M13 family peptidase [Bacteroidetes bacterium]|nr:MAG: M13 family peptidase [Bacteroidota bacterium]
MNQSKIKFCLMQMTCITLVLSACTQISNKKSADIKQDDFLWQWIDSTRNPGDDFFAFATGNWMKSNPIPESEKRWGIANLVINDNYDKLLNLCEESAKNTNAAHGSNTQKIGDFWAMGMDSLKIEQDGIKPLAPMLSSIEAIKDKQGVLNAIADMQKICSDPLFYIAIYQDEMNSNKFAVHLYQGGIGLPDRDYYFNNDSRTINIRNEYDKHLVKMFMLLGYAEKDSRKHAATVFSIEKSLASASRKLEELRDPYANYTKMSTREFAASVPELNWNDMMTRLDLQGLDSIIIAQPEFYQQVNKSLKTISIDDWKTYLRWNLLNNYASELSTAFDSQNFEFFGKVLSGVTEQRPRWKRILDSQENYLGDALGQLYVEKYVSPTMRERYDGLVQNMLDTYKDRIQGLKWMSDQTKEKALYKLSKISRKVCYPDKWKDYSSLSIGRESFAENVMNCKRWQYAYYIKKLHEPVDRTEWEMTPQTYNAYYNPSNNEIVLPAAIFLIPGLADSLADDAIIYGYAAASTIGHELTHGFDDQGRQFDADGNLKNWWTTEDSVMFSQQASLLINQFNNYIVLDSMHVNGEATLGENIADLGGVVIGFEAFKKTKQYREGKKIDGLTPTQRYFLGYSMGWLGHSRDASLAMQVMTNVHAPNFLRVNGPFANIPEFYEAFGIKEGDAMWRPDSLRVNIW